MTIKDLAALSGYSLGTVSRVLNNQPHVSEKAREQIMAIVKEQGFELNTNARNLKQTHSNNILVIVRGTHNELFAALVERLQTVATGGEYQLVVDYIGELDNEVRRAVKRVREVKPQGILFLGGSSEDFIESFAEIHIPAVLVTNSAAEFQFKNLSSVTTDDTAAAAAAVGYLADMGHKKIAVIGGEREYSDTGRLRYAGVLRADMRSAAALVRRALTERGITFDADRYYKTAHYSFDEGYTAMAELLRETSEITAVFAMADVMAIGAARAVRDAGKRIPEDISLIGFDGLPICRYYEPRLSTVTQQIAFMAEKSYAVLLDMIENGSGAQHVLAPYTLEKTDSIRKN